MTHNNDTVTLDEAKDALKRSGYLLESRIEAILRREVGFVEANVAYPDPKTKTAREIDLFSLTAHNCGKESDYIFGALIIECINNPQPIAFITKDQLTPYLTHYDIKAAGRPTKIFSRGRWYELTEWLSLKKYHHWCSGRAATQYCSFTRPKGSSSRLKEWIALHDDRHFDCIQKLRDYHIYKYDSDNGNYAEIGATVNLTFYHPIIIAQGNLLDVRQDGGNLTISPIQQAHFMHSTIVSDKTESTLHIDVVTEDGFPALLKTITDEMEEIAKRLKRGSRRVRRSIDMIAKKCKSAKTPEERRKVIEGL